MLHVVLHEPEIPSNTGNIGRTCAAVGAVLHLIRPLGFHTDTRALKRAGMDYWQRIDVRYHDSFEGFLETEKPARLVLATTKAARCYTDIPYSDGAYLMFGKESGGIPAEIRALYPENCVRIPMLDEARSLNLSNAVAVVLYEALRQLRFGSLVP